MKTHTVSLFVIGFAAFLCLFLHASTAKPVLFPAPPAQATVSLLGLVLDGRAP